MEELREDYERRKRKWDKKFHLKAVSWMENQELYIRFSGEENDMKLIKKRILWLIFLLSLIVVGCGGKKLSYEEMNYAIMMEWFGKGLSYTIEEGGEREKEVAFVSFFDPEKLYTLSRLETEGLAVMGEWDDAFTKDVIKLIEKEEHSTDQEKEMCIAMIKGGYHAIEIVEGTYTVVIYMEEFLEAVRLIEEKTGDVNDNVMPEGIRTTYFN